MLAIYVDSIYRARSAENIGTMQARFKRKRTLQPALISAQGDQILAKHSHGGSRKHNGGSSNPRHVEVSGDDAFASATFTSQSLDLSPSRLCYGSCAFFVGNRCTGGMLRACQEGHERGIAYISSVPDLPSKWRSKALRKPPRDSKNNIVTQTRLTYARHGLILPPCPLLTPLPPHSPERPGRCLPRI